MVAFGETLAANVVQEWRDRYVRYEQLKEVIEAMGEAKDDSGGDVDVREVGNMIKVISAQSLLELAERGEGRLAHAARRQYGSTEAPVVKRRSLDGLRSRFWALVETDIARAGSHATTRTAVVRERLEKAKRVDGLDLEAVRDAHAEVVALQEFVRTNGVALRKAVKKYDKTATQFGLAPALPAFMERLKTEPLMLCAATLVELEEGKIAALVSRDKLLSWKSEIASGGAAHYFNSKRAPPRHGGSRILSIATAAGLFVGFIVFPCFPDDLAASRAAAIVSAVVVLWTTNAVPYHATAFAVPPLVVVTRVLKDGSRVLGPHEAAKVVLDAFFGPSTFLLLGGYALSASLSRCQVEVAAARLLSGSSPRIFLLSLMVLACALSAVLSNATSAVLCVAVTEPYLARMDHDHPFARALLLGLAFACNVGGMLSPIASMQNIISVEALAPHVVVTFGSWMAVASPVAILSTVASWGILNAAFLRNVKAFPGRDLLLSDNNNSRKQQLSRTPAAAKYKPPLVAVCAASAVTVVLWSSGAAFLGGVGIVSLSYLALAFGAGWLTVVDLNSLSWHTLCLLGGSNVLGKAVQSSRLLAYLGQNLSPYLPIHHPPILGVLVVTFVSLVSTFVSHTVSAIIVMPLVVQLSLEAHAAAPLGLAAALAISAAQALPFSSLPNLNSLTKTDSNRKNYLVSSHFIIYGSLAQLASLLLVLLWAPIGVALFLPRNHALAGDDDQLHDDDGGL
ncbi:hypothetical protein CTAYLR_000711 [Chrysophaeum taylorii]|uniref:SPX domain-containing protein n=1 Tax=Chrysophaeum taylorii TaxID=2483200 RepID=A0AAD7XI97_9STRA|nr:hypothetical protein CTAYLR_000711 [Chrysophaeum taylorii]